MNVTLPLLPSLFLLPVFGFVSAVDIIALGDDGCTGTCPSPWGWYDQQRRFAGNAVPQLRIAPHASR